MLQQVVLQFFCLYLLTDTLWEVFNLVFFWILPLLYKLSICSIISVIAPSKSSYTLLASSMRIDFYFFIFSTSKSLILLHLSPLKRLTIVSLIQLLYFFCHVDLLLSIQYLSYQRELNCPTLILSSIYLNNLISFI